MRTIALLLCGLPLVAQTALVTGKITDSSAAVVPGASVAVTATATGVRTAALSNEGGFFTIPNLSPGLYNLSVSKDGFRPVTQTNLQLAVQQVARLDFTLVSRRGD